MYTVGRLSIAVAVAVTVSCFGNVTAVVVRNSLAPFNCITRNSVSTMVANPSIICNGEDAHGRMRAVGLVSVFVFILGVPGTFGAVLYRHREAIVDDQLMRERGEGDSALTNRNLRIRHRFRKLYEDYKPEFMFWKVASCCPT